LEATACGPRAAAIEDGATIFGRHAGAKSELLLARALGRLIRAFHSFEKSRILFAYSGSKSRKDITILEFGV